MIRKTPLKRSQKPIPKSKPGKVKTKRDRTAWLKLIQSWWDKMKSPRKCWGCGARIWGENSTLYWDHLLDKAIYPEYELEEHNHFFCCGDCHTEKGNGFPKPKHQEAIERAREEFLS